jgi:hypothetical protein
MWLRKSLVVSHARDQRTVDGWRGFRTCLAAGCEPRAGHVHHHWLISGVSCASDCSRLFFESCVTILFRMEGIEGGASYMSPAQTLGHIRRERFLISRHLDLDLSHCTRLTSPLVLPGSSIKGGMADRGLSSAVFLRLGSVAVFKITASIEKADPNEFRDPSLAATRAVGRRGLIVLDCAPNESSTPI